PSSCCWLPSVSASASAGAPTKSIRSSCREKGLARPARTAADGPIPPTGAALLLFGAILYPGGRLPDDDKPTDIVVVVKGPVQSILVREKEKVAGIWVNAARLRYRS